MDSQTQEIADLQQMLEELRRAVRSNHDVTLAAQAEAKAASRSAKEKIEKVDEIARSIAAARAAAASLQESIIATHRTVEGHARVLKNHDQVMKNMEGASVEDRAAVVQLRHTLGNETTALRKLVKMAEGRVKEIENKEVMGYEERSPIVESAVAVAAAPAEKGNPTLIDAFKTAAKPAVRGSAVGSAAAFINQGTILVLNKAVAAGLLSEAQANSEFMRSTVQLVLPFFLNVAGQYNWCPNRAFVDKASALALEGQSAEKSQELVGFFMGVAVDLLSLPAAQDLKSKLESAE